MGRMKPKARRAAALRQTVVEEFASNPWRFDAKWTRPEVVGWVVRPDGHGRGGKPLFAVRPVHDGAAGLEDDRGLAVASGVAVYETDTKARKARNKKAA